MQADHTKYWQEGIDSKALLVCFLRKLPYLLLMGVAGAVLGSGLYLLIVVMTSEGPIYYAETEYYIDFAEGRLEMKDHYNDFTWNDVMATDWILGNTMEILGSGYDRNEVGTMITADILSDVRYLTITVEGSNADMVEAVSEATKLSLESLEIRKNMDEFDSIEQIENNGVQQMVEPLFTWRAALLGSVCGILVGAFCIVAKFSVGSRYYTKQAVENGLGIPVFGLLYAEDNHAEGMQEKALQLALQYRMEKENNKKIVIMDCIADGYAINSKEILQNLYTEEELGTILDSQSCSICEKREYDAIRQTDGVILAIPFAKPCREAVTEKIMQLKNQDCIILGAVLVDVDRKWMKLYGIH